MAHHLAELIEEAEHGPTAAKRSTARKNAVQTILRIWEHRASLPGKVYPLASYENVLKILIRMWPGNNPFRHQQLHANSKIEQIAANLFEQLSRLIITFLFMEMPADRMYEELNSAAVKALSEQERHILGELQQWGELFEVKTPRATKSKKGKGKKTVDLNKIALELTNKLMSTLVELKAMIKGAHQKQADQRNRS